VKLAVLSAPSIAAPDAPVLSGWWPLPPGWWLLGLAVFLGLLWAGYLFLRQFLLATRARRARMLPVRFQALAALDELAHRPSLDAREAAYRLNEILRAALFDAEAVTVRWPFATRDGVIEDEEVWRRFWQDLDMRYQPSMPMQEADIERWLALARGWVVRLPTGDEEQDNAPMSVGS